MKEGLIALNYECSKCNERMRLYERKSAVLDGFEWVCSTITSQNIYDRAPTIILLTMKPSRLFVKICCHAVPSTRKRSAVRKNFLWTHYLTRRVVVAALVVVPSTAEEPPLSLAFLPLTWCGVERSLERGSKLRGLSPVARR
ncbi:hypothetical protein TNCV_4415601 [Trichonephila clavipes]|uniref:Uncharacterized protein n=1 Tax=Trichonephila clavipes TaxID=2585209 RepID=A0A8X6RZ49_TRICX|nr:hypothetical protein TNCV_4415601 [Trichonephila clavipes]